MNKVKAKITFLITVTVVLFFGCTTDEPMVVLPPEARFTLENRFVDINAEIGFVNESTNGYRYEWDFGDGSTSTQFEPRHSFSEHGEYDVSLTVYNENNDKDHYDIDVNVHLRSFEGFEFLSSEQALPKHKFLYFGEVDNIRNSYGITIPSNFDREALPFVWMGAVNEEVILTDSDWFFMVVDNQEPIDSFDFNDRLFFGTVINPARVLSGMDGHSSHGYFPIFETKNEAGETTDDFKIQIEFTIPAFNQN